MTNYRPGTLNIEKIVENLYFAVTGDEPDEKMKKRVYAGVEGMVALYNENQSAFYALAAVYVKQAADHPGVSKGAYELLDTIAQYLVGKSGLSNKKMNNEHTQGGI
ncbi:MAG: hypothetical protein AABX05_05660 [Nanoarchaeota archaeon]